MNDRTMIAAMAMQGMLTRSLPADATAEGVANRAMAYADALLKALAESEAEAMEWRTNDQTVVYGLRYNGELYNAYQPEQSEGIKAPMDEVGNWREYVRFRGERALAHVAAGGLAYVYEAFILVRTPQGYGFWEAVANGNASNADKARAQDFARRVLEAMEASDD